MTSVLVRTWFGDDSAWESLVREVREPSDEGFLANVIVVDDRAFEGVSAEGLREQQPDGAAVSFIADEVTLTDAAHPILAVPDRDGDLTEYRPFRVAPFALWSVENNINLGNMDWVEFTGAVGADGVFRGF